MIFVANLVGFRLWSWWPVVMVADDYEWIWDILFVSYYAGVDGSQWYGGRCKFVVVLEQKE